MRSNYAAAKNKLSGFTLIELSIVLIIIGLVAGGILVGRELIHAAQLRSTISQKAQFDTAVNTFRAKYGALPGDMTKELAESFGFFFLTSSPATGFGDNNGMIQSRRVGVGVYYGATGETILFWRHLSEAGLIPGAYGSGIDQGTGDASTFIDSRVDKVFPESKLGNGINYRVVEIYGLNYYWLLKTQTIEPAGSTSIAYHVPPYEAYTIDSKTDDGKPYTGAVRDTSSCVNLTFDGCYSTTPPALGVCTTGGAGGPDDPNAVYNTVSEDMASKPACGLTLRFN